MRLLILTNNLNVVNGVTTFIYQQSKVLIENYDYEIFIASSGGDGADKFKKLGVKLITKNFLDFEQRSYLNFILSIVFCFYIIVRFRIQIINPQNYYTAAYSFFTSKLLKLKYVQTIHSLVPNYGRLQKLFGKTFLVVNSLISEFVKKYIGNARVFLVRCPFEIKNNAFQKSKKVKVLSFGRLVKEKSFDVYLNAISLLKENTRAKAEFSIAGSGNHEEHLLEMKEKLNIEVEFKGLIKNVEPLLDTNNIFVMSTGEMNEGLGLGLIQAALHKNLIITPNYNSIRQLLINGQDGLMFNMGDSRELTDCLEYAIENYEQLKPMIENFYLKVGKEFSFEKNGKIFNEVFSLKK